ncbi:hypothetical protein M408DRAFT_313868 [Serendipita vermifera MAFF 305830]|uniref:Uncharacterized protein n=1 Tax=Serendipita vermifera MAFF 305830 TaxID=933852 RepID=A0A0C3B1V4_SERVB|nr:hypothetical protein M408DRAFT_313868 [Serendipita vermifera MAFF 305830]
MASNDQDQNSTEEIIISEELVECGLCFNSYPEYYEHEFFCPLKPDRVTCPGCGYHCLSNQDHTDEILITLDDEELVECSLCSRSYPKFHRHEVFCPLNPGRAPCPACGYKFLSFVRYQMPIFILKSALRMEGSQSTRELHPSFKAWREVEKATIERELTECYHSLFELGINFNLFDLLDMASNDHLYVLLNTKLVECGRCSHEHPKYYKHHLFCPLNPDRTACPGCGYQFISMPDARFHVEECPRVKAGQYPKAPA